MTVQLLARMPCHRIIESSGCIKQPLLVFSPAQLPWLLPQHVSLQDLALHMDSAACVSIHDTINKNLFMTI